ncbi:Transthyretin-like family-containing protein [Strongyloides ratti]|uniref:Transthyretin-like family-containing protein n=1 Tax=Strongyloides ratti TaxID=34506 RepID=A0A090KP14_STRRB|nr:Transthyretin-like family-containing protein [Strongyloides ratti]CEF59338.1 Transthyretin-like family-containing protein [Strongyloides ratti]
MNQKICLFSIIFGNIFVSLMGLPTIGTLQSAGVKGKFLCNGAPYFNAKVKLYDVDTLDLDDLMATGASGHDGLFKLIGNETEITTIDPKLNVYHNCNDEAIECLRKFSITIPQDYVTKESGTPEKIFDIGIINLSAVMPGETRDCIN